MKLPILTLISILSVSAYAGHGAIHRTDCLGAKSLLQAENTDSLTLIVYVSFTVNKKGAVQDAKVEKTECLEFDITELNKKAVEETEQEALRVVKETDDLDHMSRKFRYTLPIRVKLPTDMFLNKE